MSLDQIVPVLQLSTGPVILISGIGLVLLFMTNRLGRIVDRARHLTDTHAEPGDQQAGQHQAQLRVLARRARLTSRAILFTSISLFAAAILIITLFLTALLKLEAAILIIVLFTFCMATLIIGLVFFLIDVNLSLSTLKLEIDISP